MRATLLIILLLSTSLLLFAQEKIKKPAYVPIAGNEIVTQARVSELAKNGYVKSMNKGVSERERDSLFRLFGDRIGEKEFIILISLYTEEEKQEISANSNLLAAIKKDSTRQNKIVLLKEGYAAKDFTVAMLNGGNITLSQLKGKVVLVNFWATWCAPCLLELYDFPSKIITPFADSGFVLLAISKGEDEEKVRTKMSKLEKDGIKFNAGLDPAEQIFKLYGGGAIPKNILIDKKGMIRYTATGNNENGVDQMAKMIRELLRE